MVYAVTLHASSPTWRHTLETITLLHCGDSLTPQLLSVVLCVVLHTALLALAWKNVLWTTKSSSDFRSSWGQKIISEI